MLKYCGSVWIFVSGKSFCGSIELLCMWIRFDHYKFLLAILLFYNMKSFLCYNRIVHDCPIIVTCTFKGFGAIRGNYQLTLVEKKIESSSLKAWHYQVIIIISTSVKHLCRRLYLQMLKWAFLKQLSVLHNSFFLKPSSALSFMFD